MKKYIRSAALILLIGVLAALTLASCGKCKHEDTDWRVDIEPTCLLAGTRTKVCEECGEEIETEQYPGNHIFDEGACTYCGIPQYDTRYLQYRPITINGEEGYEVVDMGNCSQYNLRLPAIHNNKPVLAIAAGAFENRVKLKSVHISQNIAVIGDAAFAGCKALEAVTFAEESELLSFGSGVFLNCALIERIAIPAGVTTLSDGLFEGCEALSEVTVNNSLLSLGDDVFAGCVITPTLEENGIAYLGTAEKPYLIMLELKDKTKTELVIPEGTVIVAPYAANGAAIKSVRFPATLREIGGFSFAACESLSTPTFPASLVRIGKYAFAECTSITSITLPNGFLDLGMSAFRDATALGTLSLPDSIVHVGSSAFLNCASTLYHSEEGVFYVGNGDNPYLVLIKADADITQVTVNDATRVIADNAMKDIKTLTSVYIGAGVVSVGSSALSGCGALTEVVFAQTKGWQVAILYGGSDATAADVSVAADNAVAMTGAQRLKCFFRVA